MEAVAFLRKAEQSQLLHSSPFSKFHFPFDAIQKVINLKNSKLVHINRTFILSTSVKEIGKRGGVRNEQSRKPTMFNSMKKGLQVVTLLDPLEIPSELKVLVWRRETKSGEKYRFEAALLSQSV